MKKYLKRSVTDREDPDHKYLDKFDRSEVIPSTVLKSIRGTDHYAPYQQYRVYDNNDPKSCDARWRNYEEQECS